jgi:hypothetical protein
MRVLVLAKEGDQSQAATPPTLEAMAEFQKFNEELVKAGVAEARAEFERAALLTQNARERELLQRRAAETAQ